MYFILGLISGIALSTLIVATLIFLKNPIQQRMNVVEKNLSNAGPRPRGFVSIPEDESEESRKRVIEKNKQQGRDTPIEELYE